ncbi:aminopeptidase P1 [Dendrobium catenatum]|nr:aminopeptidase P1 [Dendrobium catenatum]
MASDSLDELRSLMKSHSPPLDALVVPSEDNHQSEYVSDRDKRREFISGFTGSAGLALITMNEALLWTDGRYFLQATQQLSDRWKLMRIGEDPAVENWIVDNLQSDAAVGIDPWCVSVDTAQRWTQAFSKSRQKLIQLSVNLVDEVWRDRPAAEIRPVTLQPFKFAGCTVADKLKNLREKLVQDKAYGIIVTALDEVAWLYNIRGNDVSYSPVVHAYAIVTTDLALCYVDKRKVSSEVHSSLSENDIEVREYNTVSSDVSLLASGKLISSFAAKASEENGENVVNAGHIEDGSQEKKLIWIDPASCCLALYSNLNSDQVLMQQSPLALAKAIKNHFELDGLRKAHIRDGAAVVQYLVWLDGEMQKVYGAAGFFTEPEETHKRKHQETEKLTEVSVSDKLESFRAKKEHFKGLSFPTISSVGPNASIIHYKPEAGTCAELDADSIYLFDSGAQYQDGTTDITRTVHFGKPSAHEKACYTAVLKGHIALGNAVFPNGTTGHTLDILSRIPLWKNGLDYRHGTGHGIGSYLNVHEGEKIIIIPLRTVLYLHSGNKPGYYEDGNFGIRLENVLVVKEADTKFNFGEKGYLSFEHITWAPYQKKLMNLNLMTPEEISWVNSYHSTCKEVLAPYLNDQEMEWLKKATEPIASPAS